MHAACTHLEWHQCRLGHKHQAHAPQVGGQACVPAARQVRAPREHPLRALRRAWASTCRQHTTSGTAAQQGGLQTSFPEAWGRRVVEGKGVGCRRHKGDLRCRHTSQAGEPHSSADSACKASVHHLRASGTGPPSAPASLPLSAAARPPAAPPQHALQLALPCAAAAARPPAAPPHHALLLALPCAAAAAQPPAALLRHLPLRRHPRRCCERPCWPC